MDKKDTLLNCTQPKLVVSVATLKYCQCERNLIFCINNHFQGSVICGEKTKSFEFHRIFYCLSLRLSFLDVFTAEKAIKSLATSDFPKSR